jgi:hypothetical protein
VPDGVADAQARRSRRLACGVDAIAISLWTQNARNNVRKPVAQRSTHPPDSAITTVGP